MVEIQLQRLYSHASMFRSLRADEDATEREMTSLIQYTPTQDSYWSVGPVLAIALLILVFIAGTGISIILLCRSDYPRFNEAKNAASDHSSLLLIKREDWVDLPDVQHEVVDVISTPLREVIIVATGGPTCNEIFQCVLLLKTMQVKTGKIKLVNFLISSDGTTYEALGWDARSPMFPHIPALVIGFIGTFTHDSPSVAQVEEAFNLFDTSIAKGYLTPDFSIIGKTTTKQIPTQLFYAFQNLIQWNEDLSDDY